MWLICISAVLTLEVVLGKSVPRQADEESLEVPELDERTLDYIDKGIANPDLRWPLGVVSYHFDNSSYDYLVEERVRKAMNTIEETSCVRFKPILEPWSETPWIHITNKKRLRDCSHETAVNGTGLEIIMTMGIDCMQRRDILHLLMHALGFKDEVTHPQRDQYVRILWDNINPAYRSLFRIRHDDFPSRTTEYDPISIMHFHDRAFTKNGQATIASLVPGLVINPSRELSPLDKMKLRMMFGHECNRRQVGDLLDSCKNAMQGKDNDKKKILNQPDIDDNKELVENDQENGENGEVNNSNIEKNENEEKGNEENENVNEENVNEENVNEENLNDVNINEENVNEENVNEENVNEGNLNEENVNEENQNAENGDVNNENQFKEELGDEET